MGKTETASFITGFVLGLAAGSAIGLLVAPAQGRETRRRLGEEAPQLGNRVGTAAQTALAGSKGLAAQGLARLGATAGEARGRLFRKADIEPADGTVLSTGGQSGEQQGGGG